MVSSTRLLRLLCRIGRLGFSRSTDRCPHHRSRHVTAFRSRHGRSPITHFIAIWDIYAIVSLLMAWVTICTANPRTIQRRARLQDSSRTFIFIFIIVAACMSLLAVILVIREHKALQNTGGLHLFMAVLAVIESWLLIHTVFTLRYAHIFYRSEQELDVEGSGGGLIFPGGLIRTIKISRIFPSSLG